MRSRKYVGKSKAPYDVIGLQLSVRLKDGNVPLQAHLQAEGTIPPVNIVAYGYAAPATRPSTSSRTSRNGPSPKGASGLGGRSERNSFAVLEYC